MNCNKKPNKGKTCPKQPGNAPPIPSDAKICTGCDSSNGVDRLSDEDIERSIHMMEYFKHVIFSDDHPGIDKIVKDMQKQKSK